MSQNTNCGEPDREGNSQQFATEDEKVEDAQERLAKTIWGNLKKALRLNEKRTLHEFCRENDLTYKTLCNQIHQNKPPKLHTLVELAKIARTSVSYLISEMDNVLNNARELEVIRKYRANSSFANCVDFIYSLTPETIRDLSRLLADLRKEARLSGRPQPQPRPQRPPSDPDGPKSAGNGKSAHTS